MDKETGLETLQVIEDCQDYMRMIIGGWEDGEGDWHVMTIIIALIRSQSRSIKVGLDFFLPISSCSFNLSNQIMNLDFSTSRLQRQEALSLVGRLWRRRGRSGCWWRMRRPPSSAYPGDAEDVGVSS